MEKKNKIIIIGLMIMVMILAIVGATYAFFTATVTDGDKGSSVIIQTGSLRLVYSDTEFINESGILPGDTYSKTVSVTNEGNVNVYYDLVWIELLNELSTKSDLVMSMTCASSTDTCNGYSETTVANSGSNIPILYNVEIGALEVHTYVITILFKETGSNQNDNQGKNITGKIGIIEARDLAVDLYGYVYDESSSLMSNVVVELHSDPISVVTDANGRYELPDVPLGTHTVYVKTSDKTSTIMTTTMSIKYGSSKTVDGTNATVMKSDSATIGINIYKTGSTPLLALNLPTGTMKKWSDSNYYSYSESKWVYTNYLIYKDTITNVVFDNKIDIPGDAVSSWDISEDNSSAIMAYVKSDGASGYQLHIQVKDEMYAPIDSTDLFEGLTHVTTITGLQYFDTSKVTNMNHMFGSMNELTVLDLSTIDTSNVSNMSSLFSNLKKIVTLNLNNFNTSKVTNIDYMFYGCSSLISLDLSMLDVSKVTNFAGGGIFSGCSLIEYINISNWDFTSATSMNQFFNQIYNLETIVMKNINTSTITDMGYLFKNLHSLKALDLSDLDTDSLTRMPYMFRECWSLTSLDLSMFNTSNISVSGGMSQPLYGCNSLTTLNLSNWVFNGNFKPSDFLSRNALNYGTSTISVIFDNADTTAVTSMTYWFSDCASIASIDLSDFDFENVTTMFDMFEDCINLTSINFGNINSSKLTNISGMLHNCIGLTSIDMSNFDFSLVTSVANLYSDCTNLTNINLTNVDFSAVTSYDNMFQNVQTNVLIRTKDATAQTWITSRFIALTNVTIG